jgi:hypothetical protein
MRVVVYDEAGEIALDYNTRSDTLSLCAGRLEKALVVEALLEAAFFVMDGRTSTDARGPELPRACIRGGPGRVTGP